MNMPVCELVDSAREKLTDFTDSGGCGCKVPANLLSLMLETRSPSFYDARQLVGLSDNDDAAIFQVTEDEAVVMTTDFFPPMVNDPFLFGRIAAAHAISDVFAMGGKPCWVNGLMGWPTDELPYRQAQQVIHGAMNTCLANSVVYAGGHTIKNSQPLFGLAVVGLVRPANVKRKGGASENDLIFLLKPLGTGVINHAIKLGVATEEEILEVSRVMTQINSAGCHFGTLKYVHAMTDITGFGLLGHLLEVCIKSNVSAIIYDSLIPELPAARAYIERGLYSSGSDRNLQSFRSNIRGLSQRNSIILSDPQTNGGLLVTVKEENEVEFSNELSRLGLVEYTRPIGRTMRKKDSDANLIEIASKVSSFR